MRAGNYYPGFNDGSVKWHPSDILGSGGVYGNVYYVMKTTETKYTDFLTDYDTSYTDGSTSVCNTITAALAKTVAERNDYVIVMPSATDYDEGATLTMNKAGVHLIAPGGLGVERGCIRSATIDPNTSATAVTISGRGCELAGFWLRGYAENIVVDISSTGGFVHHNDVAIASTSSSGTVGAGIHVSGAGTKIENNYVFSNAGTSATILYGISCDNGTTRAVIRNNTVQVSNGCTMTNGIQTGSGDVMVEVEGNHVFECPAAGSTLAGTLTAGIRSGTGTMVVNNRVGIATEGNAVIGGTADQSYISNYEGTSGGTLAV